MTCLDTLESGALLASGSADMTVKVSDTVNYTDKTLAGHSGPILSVSLDPLKKFVASSSCDGTVRVWEFETKQQVKLTSQKVKNSLNKKFSKKFSKTFTQL